MKNNRIEDLRNQLFLTIEALLDKKNPMDLDRAKTVSEVAGAIIQSAKVEVDFLKVTNAIEGTGFIPYEPRKPLEIAQ
ncbi:MAG: hypothetical protein M0P69_06020 [Bacteroidales bacterium]|nr:hypothetical protein [Bacteroidales bacterium]